MQYKRRITAAFAAASIPVAAAAIPLHVDDDSTAASPDGLTWATAFPNLQDALAAAAADATVEEIRVAAGTYFPDVGASVTPGDRGAAFVLLAGQVIRGGYAGLGAPDPDERDPSLHITILSGDIGIPNDNSDNTFNIITMNFSDGAVIDGVTFTGGRADGPGVQSVGGAIRTSQTDYTITDCVFIHNETAVNGGAVYTAFGNATVIRCAFVENHAEGNGGGFYNADRSNGAFLDCVFLRNSADLRGGAMYLNRCAEPSITNCLFDSNTSSSEGGAIYTTSNFSPTMTNCTVVNNIALLAGGIFITQTSGLGSMAITNSIFWNNVDATLPPSGEPHQIRLISGQLFINYSCVQSWSGTFGGVGNTPAPPNFVNAPSADYRLAAGSPLIDAGDSTTDISRVEPGHQPLPPTDLNAMPRIVDDPSTPDTGVADPISAAVVDIGAYEFQPPSCSADLDGDGVVGAADLGQLLGAWGQPGPADFDNDGAVTAADLGALLGAWGPCP